MIYNMQILGIFTIIFKGLSLVVRAIVLLVLMFIIALIVAGYIHGILQ